MIEISFGLFSATIQLMPLKFKAFETGPLHANCVIVYDTETKEAVVFDPSGPTGIIPFILVQNLSFR